MRKHNQIHTLGAPHYKAHFRFLRKLKDFKWTLGPKNTVVGLRELKGFREGSSLFRGNDFLLSMLMRHYENF